MEKVLEKLKNPVWHALYGRQSGLGVSVGDFKYYSPEYTPFSAFQSVQPKVEDLLNYAKLNDHFFLIGNDLEQVPDGLEKVENLETCQMVLGELKNISIAEEIVPLNGKFEEELKGLINLVQPGFFKEKTVDMGSYYGIFKDGQLVSVAGERMKVEGATEVSGVVSHPDYSGRGFSQQLIAYVSKRIQDRGEIAFLHTGINNKRAIGLYKYLGFEEVRIIDFYKYTLKEE